MSNLSNWKHLHITIYLLSWLCLITPGDISPSPQINNMVVFRLPDHSPPGQWPTCPVLGTSPAAGLSLCIQKAITLPAVQNTKHLVQVTKRR